MTELIEVPFGPDNAENATLLLAAAEDLDLDPAVAVRTVEGAFVVPKEVHDKAFGKAEPESPTKKAPAKKAAAKKAAAKDKQE